MRYDEEILKKLHSFRKEIKRNLNTDGWGYISNRNEIRIHITGSPSVPIDLYYDGIEGHNNFEDFKRDVNMFCKRIEKDFNIIRHPPEEQKFLKTPAPYEDFEPYTKIEYSEFLIITPKL